MCVAYRQDSEVGTMKIYWEFFKSFDVSDFEKAVKSSIATSEFFPTVAKIFKALEQITNIVPTEADVINDLKVAMVRYGTQPQYMTESPKFKYPMSNALAEEIGWQSMGDMREEEFQKSVHFRYSAVADHYRNCLYSGQEFPINRIKGKFADTSFNNQLSSGATKLGGLLEQIQSDKNDGE